MITALLRAVGGAGPGSDLLTNLSGCGHKILWTHSELVMTTTRVLSFIIPQYEIMVCGIINLSKETINKTAIT